MVIICVCIYCSCKNYCIAILYSTRVYTHVAPWAWRCKMTAHQRQSWLNDFTHFKRKLLAVEISLLPTLLGLALPCPCLLGLGLGLARWHMTCHMTWHVMTWVTWIKHVALQHPAICAGRLRTLCAFDVLWPVSCGQSRPVVDSRLEVIPPVAVKVNATSGRWAITQRHAKSDGNYGSYYGLHTANVWPNVAVY